MFLLLWRILSNTDPAGWSWQITPICNLYPAVCGTETILLSSHLKASKMVWCSPLSFWTHHELYPQPKFVCCPNCMRCKDTRSAHLPWAHSLNWIVTLASFLTMSPGKAHTVLLLTYSTCMTLFSTEKPCDTYTQTHTTPNASNQGHQVSGLGFGWLVGNFLVNVSFSFPFSTAKGKWRDDLSVLLHSSLPKKTNRNILWPACWPTAQE